jgi:DNA-binding NarL/FixJ family response regulator
MTRSASAVVVRVVVAGGLTFGRYAIRQALQDRPDIVVVGEAEGIAEAAREVQEGEARVLIYDASADVDRGLRSAAAIHRRAPRAGVVVVTDVPSRERPAGALRVSEDVSEILGPETTRDQLIGAVLRVAASEDAPRGIVHEARRRAGPGNGRRAGSRPPLNHAEVSVARAIAEGDTDREIADRLAIPVATVKSHIRSILRKMGAVNRTSAITAAFRSRVLE